MDGGLRKERKMGRLEDDEMRQQKRVKRKREKEEKKSEREGKKSKEGKVSEIRVRYQLTYNNYYTH